MVVGDHAIRVVGDEFSGLVDAVAPDLVLAIHEKILVERADAIDQVAGQHQEAARHAIDVGGGFELAGVVAAVVESFVEGGSQRQEAGEEENPWGVEAVAGGLVGTVWKHRPGTEGSGFRVGLQVIESGLEAARVEFGIVVEE